MPNKLRVWFYSGDADGCVSTIGTIRWLKKTGWKVNQYTHWKYMNQKAGIYQKYENGFTFITVKGAGHLASVEKRPQMKFLFDSFIKGTIL